MTTKSKTGYTLEFKIRVLEYYFKNGGKSKFGLKSKTAQLFNIDHKTISRMLCNPDIVKKAQQSMNTKKTTGCSKTVKSCPTKIKGKVNLPKKKISPKPCSESSTSEDQNVDMDTQSTGTDNNAFCEDSEDLPKISVLELPEDPDYSLLKESIGPSSNGANDIAKLLIKGTDEVRQVVTNECDLIYECKVCRNLFRSVINFLAHKRLYCQDKFHYSQQPFHKDPGPSLVPEPGITLCVSPSPPPPTPPPIPPGKLTIESIVSNLSNANEINKPQGTPIATKYSQRLIKQKQKKEALNTINMEPRVYLKPICGVSAAVYQTTIPPSEDDNPISDIIQEIAKKKRKLPDAEESHLPNLKKNLVHNNEEPSFGESAIPDLILYCPKCTTQFNDENLVKIHIEKEHGVERTLYTCPICSMVFMTIGGCVKHLNRVHKKKKHQRERLKMVIKNRSIKKVMTSDELIAQLKNRSPSIKKELEYSTNHAEMPLLIVKEESKSPIGDEEVLPSDPQEGIPSITQVDISPGREKDTQPLTKQVIQPLNQREMSSVKQEQVAIQPTIEPIILQSLLKRRKIKPSVKQIEALSSINLDVIQPIKKEDEFHPLDKPESQTLSKLETAMELQFPSEVAKSQPSFPSVQKPQSNECVPIKQEELMPFCKHEEAPHVSNYGKQFLRDVVYVNKISPKITPSHDCPKCGQRFVMSDAASSHVTRCMCIKEGPTKKIEIQIRKDYAKEITSPNFSSNNNSPSRNPKLSNEILIELKKVCNFGNLTCIPCERKYHTVNVLKRHIAQHIGWTRFSCATCSFRTYEKYQCLQHCIAAHNTSEKESAELILDDQRLEVLQGKNESVDIKPEEIIVKNFPILEDDIGQTTNESGAVSYMRSNSDIHKSDFSLSTKSNSSMDDHYKEITPPLEIMKPKDRKKTITIKTVTIKPSDVKSLEASNCNARNLNVLNLKEVKNIKKIPKLDTEKINGEDS